MDLKIISKILIDSMKFDSLQLPKCDVLTFACDNDRYIKLRGKMYSPLINTIEDRLSECSLDCVSITRIASTIKGELSHGRVYSPEGSFARAMIAKRIKGLFSKKGKYPFSWMEVKIWESILNKTHAKAVVAILPSRELCYACRKRGIWVCDIQHGVIANEHYWYGADFRSTDPIEWLPNAYLVWDSGSHAVINKWAEKKAVEVTIVGNPWIDRFKSNSRSDQVVTDLKNAYKFQANDKENVLLTLSWGGHGLENRFIHPSLEEFIKITANEFNWRIRLHPNQVKGFASNEGRDFIKYYDENLRELGVEWESTTSMPLPLLLSDTDYHVTWLSSVCMEAAYFGVPSLVLSPKLQKGGGLESYYEYLVALGYVEKAKPEYRYIKQWFIKKANSKLPKYCDYSQTFEDFIRFIADRTKSI